MAERSLTILQVTHAGHEAGSTFMIHSLSASLARRGHRVLVGCRADSVLAQLTTKAGLPVVPLDFRRLGRLADELAAVMEREHVDLINSHDTRDRRALTWLRWRKRLRQGFVVTRQTMPRTSPPELLAIGLTADRTIAVSHAVARGLRRRLYPAGRLRVVPNGIDFAQVDQAPSREAMSRVAAALGDVGGRSIIVVLARRKDQDVLLEALAFVERPLVLVCVGIAPDVQLQALTARLPARHRVVYVPFTDQPLAFYRVATLAALPSRIEGLSLALLEGLALGLPVVASRAGGNSELIKSGETGLLVPPLNRRAWAAAVEQLLADPAFAARLAHAGRDFVRREHSLDRMVDRTEIVYREAMERRRTRSGGAGTVSATGLPRTVGAPSTAP
ncbi:MAG TPA: glycosyltransferase family 4 protein [Gemmatimonadales bacterium]|nr:glycosyltransferase family 4 protein [Gemmatimonadales bacterium]